VRDAAAVSLAGYALATDPASVGRQFARALGTIVCRCAHGRRTGAPCARCAGFGRAQAPRLGRLLFAVAQGVPYGQRPLTDAEYARVGRLLEQVEQLAAGEVPTAPDD